MIKSHYRILFSELRNLDLELAKVPPGPQYDDVRGQYYFRIFNTLNWLSSMINEKMITDKKMIEHMKAVIARYYDETFVKNVSVDEEILNFTRNLQNFIEISRNSFCNSAYISTLVNPWFITTEGFATIRKNY